MFGSRWNPCLLTEVEVLRELLRYPGVDVRSIARGDVPTGTFRHGGAREELEQARAGSGRVPTSQSEDIGVHRTYGTPLLASEARRQTSSASTTTALNAP